MSEEANAEDTLSVSETNLDQDSAPDKGEEKGHSSSLYYGEDEFISHQTDQTENSIYSSLLDGFRSLKEIRENKKKPVLTLGGPNEESDPNEERSTKQWYGSATVNFIDPTTKSNAPTTAKTDNMMAKQQQASTTRTIENVYAKLTSIFEREYESTLRTVQYRSMRSGETDVISTLKVTPVLTPTGGGPSNGDAAWGGMAGTLAAPVSDPSEWHNSPFCHVYIATIESLDHYRSKIRPSLRAFVSQIESAATTTTSSNSSDYLIVYIPTGPKDANTESQNNEAVAKAGKFFGHRILKARERLTNYNSGGQDLDASQHSRDSVLSDDLFDEDGSAESGSAHLNLLTPTERKIFKKINADFSYGKVCVLSVDSLDKAKKEAVTADGVSIRTSEWNGFNRTLGTVIVSGFKDRCRRYNDELRRLDTQRAAAATAAKAGKKAKTSGTTFNLSHFFLVKESLALTYEQMHLPGDALLQYDEFRAFLPDLTDKEYKKAKKDRRKAKGGAEEASPTLLELADAGDLMNFRRRIRSEFDLNPIIDTMKRYIFARELSLVFQMEQPVEVISRCAAFSKLMYSVMLRGLPELSPEEQLTRKAAASKWFIQFSWDVKCASEQYMTSLFEISQNNDAMSIDTPGSDLLSGLPDSVESEQAVAASLSQLLEISRMLLKELGDTELATSNPLRSFDSKLPDDMTRPWQPWREREKGESRSLQLRDSLLNASSSFRLIAGNETERCFLLKGAFSSATAYEQTYLELSAAIITLSRYSGSRRIAARLQEEIAEYYIREGEYRTAAAVFKSIVKICRWDQWDRCHFWRLFRLAYCQRATAKPTDYLKTLVTCFSPRITAVAPPKALCALQDDLEVIVGHPLVGESRYGKLAFIETEMSIVEISSEETALDSGFDQKQLYKRFCSVSEKVGIMITITSHLPRDIELNSLKLFVVSFARFSEIIESGESVEEEDAIRCLPVEAPILLKPGKNTYALDWKPSSTGQYILSTIEVVWKEGYFYYDSMDLPAPLLGVDVLPSEPTHSLSMDPGYLVPGHDQQVRITFDAGADSITSGKIQLLCSEGLTLIPPGEDPGTENWQKDCEIELNPLKPSETIALTTYVRCGFSETFSHDSSSQVSTLDEENGLSAKAFTRYLHSETDDTKDEVTSPMKNVLESFAPLLDKTALSVEAVDAVWIIPGVKAMVSINLMSNSPHNLSIEEWNLILPAPLHVADDGDFNVELLKCTVSNGDQLAMAFECVVSEEKAAQSSDEPILQVTLLDGVGKTFSLDLSLDLNSFYLILWESDIAKPLGNLTAVLHVDVCEGNVGEPVTMKFTVDCNGLRDLKSNEVNDGGLMYSICWEDSNWVLGGKVNGIMDHVDSLLSCEVVGVPTVPGHLSRFPTLKMEYESTDGKLIPLNVKCQHPPPFRSLSKTNENGVAFLTSK